MGNVVVRVGGVHCLQPSSTPKWSADLNHQVVKEALDAFGVDRCMIGSNFPVDSLCGDYSTIIGGFLHIVRGLGLDDAEVAALFCDNALRVYRIDAPAAASTNRMSQL